MNYFVHPSGLCESKKIGGGTRIWAFAHVLAGATIGDDCNVCDHTFIENDVVVGDRVTIKCGVQLWDGIRLEDEVFIGPNATFTNDRFPRSKAYPQRFLETRVCRGASVGANATILPGIIIGENAMVGAGAVVTRSVPPNAIVAGNPARIIGYTSSPATLLTPAMKRTNEPPPDGTIQKSLVSRVTLHYFHIVKDLRGNLSVGEFEREIPFVPKRYFLVFEVPTQEVRGEHAHKLCHQFLICVSGSCMVTVDDGKNREQFFLDRPNMGLYLPPLTWGIQHQYSDNAILVVFASHFYESQDYIRNYEEFLAVKKSEGN